MQVKGYDIKDDIVLEIGRFSILWNWFEHFWCDNNCCSEKIKKIAKTIRVDLDKQAYFAKVLNQRRHWFGQLVMDYVTTSLHPENARASSEDDITIMRQFMEQTGDSLTRGCLLIIYRIRNNLMHGMKTFEELNGQIELFRSANEVLESMSGD